MTHGHSIWFLIITACVVWYSTITIYVAIKGRADIRDMLRDLRDRDDTAKADAAKDSTSSTSTDKTA
jgi:hypothetical protein